MVIFNPKGEIVARAKDTKLVRLRSGIAIDGQHVEAGEVIAAPAELAYDLLGSGRADEATEEEFAEAEEARAKAKAKAKRGDRSGDGDGDSGDPGSGGKKPGR